MKNGTVDLTIGSLWANIWHMSWPMLIIMLLNFLVGIVDVYVAGFISPKVQAAVGYVSQLSFLTIIIANAISIGSLSLVCKSCRRRGIREGCPDCQTGAVVRRNNCCSLDDSRTCFL